MSVITLDLLPSGVHSEPLFKTDEDYQRFRDEFIRDVVPVQEQYRLARIASIIDSMYHMVD